MPLTSSPTALHSTSPRRKPISRTTIWQMAPLLASSRGHDVPRESLSAPLAVFLSRYARAFSLWLPSSTAALARTENPSIGRAGADIAGMYSVVFPVGIPALRRYGRHWALLSQHSTAHVDYYSSFVHVYNTCGAIPSWMFLFGERTENRTIFQNSEF